ncbi:adenosylcobinamide-phosphate synthase CbiB [Amylibacter sp. IMCC11727]|uniref:adenosylcobinamide-phosphate synthase CbiB n=1 Tax=Amylibacter sp. IMCC11727 TaxID=3039851 RepID=UPI00244E11C5|nr:adenosylcobinamide-phosphate synthase CbiB [Amylibacter sp. IMCC11727]WGI21628.1 adenosylcobinamide-phosphate synthase CbiB [Amylibacter sp. IMCC11727]
MSVFLMVLLALLLDFFLGEPEKVWDRYPHPATLMGRVVNWLDETLNNGSQRQVKGFVAVGVMIVVAFIPGLILEKLNNIEFLGFDILVNLVEVVIAAVLIAHRSLIDHVRDVATALQSGLPQGRNAVSMIVGRDTGQMSETDVSRAAIESAAENFSDGVIAPVFWFLILGLPGILIYKMINTADSMIGYRTEEYAEFGFAAAKLDDLLNWLPARISAMLICAVHFDRTAFDVVFEDADLHRSPNAGWPESAMAGVLDVSLAGPRSYDGQMSDDLFVNRQGKRDLNAQDVLDSVKALNRSWFGLAGFFGLFTLLFWIL